MIYAFCGQKGGIGKSAAAICVAAELMARNRNVLLVDCDPQATALTWSAVAGELGHTTPTTVAMKAGMHRPDQLPKVARAYDDVVIDCPPRLAEAQRSALMASDVAVLPCGPTLSDTWALTSSLELVREAQTYRPKLRACVLITRKQHCTTLGRGARQALLESSLPVLEAELGYRVAFQEFLGAGLGVTQYEPTGAAADEVRALVDELERFASAKRSQAKRSA
jgi:chromosome partitioning protein